MEPIGNARLRPWNGVGFIPPHYKAAHVFFPIGQAIGVAQGGKVRGDAFDLLGDHILVLNRHERNIHADGCSQRSAPLPGAANDLFAFDGARWGFHAANLPVF